MINGIGFQRDWVETKRMACGAAWVGCVKCERLIFSEKIGEAKAI
jgi:hypothetical protein